MIYSIPFLYIQVKPIKIKKEGAMIPSENSFWIILAVAMSQTSDNAIKSPYEDILSAPLAIA